MPELINSEKLPEQVRKIFLPFVEVLLAAPAADIVSIFIYGSATGINFIPRTSDINSVVVARVISPPLREKTRQLLTAARNRRLRAPLFLTPELISSSLDVFCLEFGEMRDNYVVLFGSDVLRDLVIDAAHVRLFCEQQLKGKLIRIRQGYVESGTNKRAVESLLKESLNTLFPVFRALLRLKHRAPPADKSQILTSISAAFTVSTAAMQLIWQDKKNDARISGREVQDVFERYVPELEALAEQVDRL